MQGSTTAHRRSLKQGLHYKPYSLKLRSSNSDPLSFILEIRDPAVLEQNEGKFKLRRLYLAFTANLAHCRSMQQIMQHTHLSVFTLTYST